MSPTKREDELPYSDPENPWRPGTLLGGLWEWDRAIRRWIDSQRKPKLPLDEGQTAPPSGLSERPAKRRRGRQTIDEDRGLLILMAQMINADEVENNRPTPAVRLLPGYADVPEHNRKAFEDRLVGKYNSPEFQQELSQLRNAPDWRVTIERRKKSRFG